MEYDPRFAGKGLFRNRHPLWGSCSSRSRERAYVPNPGLAKQVPRELRVRDTGLISLTGKSSGQSTRNSWRLFPLTTPRRRRLTAGDHHEHQEKRHRAFARPPLGAFGAASVAQARTHHVDYAKASKAYGYANGGDAYGSTSGDFINGNFIPRGTSPAPVPSHHEEDYYGSEAGKELSPPLTTGAQAVAGSLPPRLCWCSFPCRGSPVVDDPNAEKNA